MAARNYYVAPLTPANYADGAAFTGLSLLDISPTGPTGSQRFLGGYVAECGTVLRLRAMLSITCTTGGTATLTVGFYWGGIAGTSIAGAAGIATITGAAAWPFIMEYEGEFRAIGAGGSLVGSGKLYTPASLTTFNTPIPIPQTAAARTIAVNTITNNPLTVGANWSSATGTPSITCNRFLAELVG